MSKEINDGGPAFPVEVQFMPDGSQRAIQTGHMTGWAPGMSRRDWFAGQALMGLLASERFDDAGHYSEDVAADRARRMADALVAALSRPVNAGGE